MKTETKMMQTADADKHSQQLLGAFEAFKASNDARLAEIERRGASDPLLDEKLARIDDALQHHKQTLDRIILKEARPGLNDEPQGIVSEHKSAWGSYLRSGDESRISRLDTKAWDLSAGSDAGFVAPPELDRMIESRLLRSSPMRQIASVRQTSANVYSKPVGLGADAVWVGENGTRAETPTPTLSLLEFPMHELYAMPAATQTLLDDSYADIDEWLADEVETAFAAQESQAFINGTGNDSPTGLLSYTQIADNNHVWGQIGYISSANSGGFDPDSGADVLIDLIHTVKNHYRSDARFVMNRRTASEARKLKDRSGRYIWTPGTAGEGSSLLGYPVTEIEDMPDIAADVTAVAFGDFRRAYLIVDRQGARVLRDPYSSKPFVLFYTTKRVGGGVQDFDAVKLLKF